MPPLLTQSNDRATDVNKTPLFMLMIITHILKTGKVYEALFSSKQNVPNLLNICAGSEQAAAVALTTNSDPTSVLQILTKHAVLDENISCHRNIWVAHTLML